MSQPKRFHFDSENGQLFEAGLGEFVRHADYAALQAENERLRLVAQDNKAETEATRLQNERLRKAGDAMDALIVDELAFYEDDGNKYGEVKAWRAAKGVQS